eukprot:TRINITY_DN1679_c0_g1_i2.p1 TRINITY_DN1679_c0_g1~~TRINITY_DN1679_c0_g1_i2.p1  ORF type:complete len:492 (-),score=95.29 TRINITY_DN1679_c0_g1_i2:403-1878(-)
MLAVVASQSSEDFFGGCDISFDEVKTIFTPSLAEATFVNEIFPDAPQDVPSLYIPDAKSGTRDFFEEATGLDFSGVTGYVDDEQLVSALLNDQTGVGFGVVPLAFASRNAERLIICKIDGVDPTDATQVDAYPLARPLYKYYDNAPGVNNFAVLDYLCALLGDEGQSLVSDLGYIPLSAAEVADGRDQLLCDDRFGSQKRVDLTGAMEDAATCGGVKRFVLIGSSTVYPISVEVARLYNSAVVVDPRSTGSTIGILDLIAGAVPIAGASRSIRGRDYEAFDCDPDAIVGDSSNRAATQSCQGVEPKGVIVGYDMLAVIVSPDSPVDSLTFDQLVQIFVDKVPSGADFTGSPTLVVPDINSGTRGFFDEVVGEVNVPGFVNDNDIASRVAADPNAIGFIGVAYAASATNIKTVTIDDISPTDFSQASDYALSRPLFYYYNEGPTAENAGDVKDLLCWVLGDKGQSIVETVGYVSLKSAFPEVLATEQENLKC